MLDLSFNHSLDMFGEFDRIHVLIELGFDDFMEMDMHMVSLERPAFPGLVEVVDGEGQYGRFGFGRQFEGSGFHWVHRI